MFSKDKKILTNLEEAIISVIVFFDMFDYPVTDFEVWKYCALKCNFSDIRQVLIAESGYLKNVIESKNGFYFLDGRSGIVETRLRRYNIADKKFKKALLVAKLFKLIPWIRLIAVGNIIGSNNLRDEGDIDLFIITKNRRIWVTRFFCVLIVKFLRMRPEPNNTKNKICLSFFVGENCLNLEKLMLSEKDDCYFVHWLAGLVPVYEVGNFYEKLINENIWINDFLPNWKMNKIVSRRKISADVNWFYEDVLDILIGGAEKLFRRLQMRLMASDIKNKMNQSAGVVVNDFVLKFHLDDKREELAKKFKNKKEDVNKKLNG